MAANLTNRRIYQLVQIYTYPPYMRDGMVTTLRDGNDRLRKGKLHRRHRELSSWCKPGLEDDYCSSSKKTPELTDGVQGNEEEEGRLDGGTISALLSRMNQISRIGIWEPIVLSSNSTIIHCSST